MQVIYKYEIKQGANKLSFPGETLILSVQNQNNKITMWCLHNKCDDEEIKIKGKNPIDLWKNRYFMPIGTGWDIDKAIEQTDLSHRVKSLDYVSTVQQGDLVWHIFEVIV